MATELAGMSLDEKREAARQKLAGMSLDEKRAMARSIVAQQGPTAQGAGEVIQEQHPDVTFGERFAIKNFGGDLPTVTDYLKRNHPDLEVGVRGDQVILRRPGEQNWRVVDPAGVTGIGELGKDVADVGYDVASGIASGAATALGGLAGAAGGLGVGALPGAAAAGAASSAGLEALRQKIGQGLGVYGPEMSGTDIAISGGIGALSPLLMGTGATAGQIAKKAALPGVAERLLERGGAQVAQKGALSAAEKAAAEQLLAQSQRGVSRFLPTLGEMTSGVSKETIKSAGRKVSPKVAEMLSVAPDTTMLKAGDVIEQQGVMPLVTGLSDSVNSTLSSVKAGLQDEIGAAIDATGETLSTLKYEEPFRRIRDALPEAKRPADIEKARAVDALLKKHFPENLEVRSLDKEGKRVVKLVPRGPMSAREAMVLRQELKDLTRNFASTEGKASFPSEIINAAKEAYAKLGDDLYTLLNKADKEAGGKGNLAAKYREHMEIERLADQYFSDPLRTYATMRTLSTKAKRALREEFSRLDRKYGTNISDAMSLLDVSSVFGNPSLDALSAKAGTSTSRSLGLAGLGGGLGYAAGAATLGPFGGPIVGGLGGFLATKVGSPAAVKKALELQQFVKGRYDATGIPAAVRQFAESRPKTATTAAAAKTGTPQMIWNLMRRGE